VEVGDIIGYVGDSGNAKGTPPHVHYGIYIQGRAVNPYPLLVKD
jgi:murein DD-endopeptidase MepM/ murein hydrolase activator NlpD